MLETTVDQIADRIPEIAVDQIAIPIPEAMAVQIVAPILEGITNPDNDTELPNTPSEPTSPDENGEHWTGYY